MFVRMARIACFSINENHHQRDKSSKELRKGLIPKSHLAALGKTNKHQQQALLAKYRLQHRFLISHFYFLS